MSKQWVEVTVAYETHNDYGRAAWDAMPGALSVKHIESVTPYPAHGERIQGDYRIITRVTMRSGEQILVVGEFTAVMDAIKEANHAKRSQED